MVIGPMQVGEILDYAFRLYRDNLKNYLSMAGIYMIPALLFTGLAMVIPLMGEDSIFLAMGTGIGILLLIIPMIVLYLAMEGGSIKMATQQVMEQSMGIKEAYRFGLSKAWPLFAGTFLMGLCVTLGLMLLIIPGIIVAVWFSLYQQVVVLEGKGASASLSRSKQLVKGNFWRATAVVLVVYLITGTIGQLVAIPFNALGVLLLGPEVGTLIGNLGSMLISALVMPYSFIATTLLYFDLRARKEGYDLELMADGLTHGDAQSF